MAASSEYETRAEPFCSPNECSHGLGSISEGGHSRAPSASPEPHKGRFGYFGLTVQETPHKRSSTYPPPPPNTSDELPPKVLGRSSTAYPSGQKQRTKLPTFKRVSLSESNLTSKKQIRQSTFDTNYSASFADTAVWDQKTILSLDGGGIRGYSALLILQELMRVIGRIEEAYKPGPSEADGPAQSSYHPLSPSLCTATGSRPPYCPNESGHPRTESSPWLPCHYFDYVAGTSTGGLIGIMLGRLRMNIDDCIREYESLGAKVFGHSRMFHLRSPLWWPRDKYNHKTLEDVVKDVVKRRVPKVAEFPGGRNFAFDENRCRTVVVAFQHRNKPGVDKPYLFRTYKNLHKSKDLNDDGLDRNPNMAHDIPIWQVARATSAAPTYFEPMVIDELEYIDGGFGANNPCVEIYDEVRRMNNDSNKCTKLILSIGTGKNNEESRFNGHGFSRYVNYLNFARKWASDSEQTHLTMLKAKNSLGFGYFRFNVEGGLGQMKLDEWRARGPVRIKIGSRIGNFRSPKVNPTAGTEPDPHAEGQSDISLAIEEKARVPLSRFDGDSNEELTNPRGYQNGHLRGTQPSKQSQFAKTETPDFSSAIPEWFRPKNETLDTMRNRTHDYLSQDEMKKWIKECASLLVEGRRGRAKNDPQRWEKACFGAWYQCTISECPRAEKEYGRHELKKHLLDKHKDRFTRDQEGQATLEEALDTCKIIIH